jgi:dUTP pyrophosphatase
MSEAGGQAVPVLIEQLPHGKGLPLPAYATALAAGADLMAAVPAGEPVQLAPGARALVPTGIRIALPPGFEAQVRPRSGLALRHGITVLNAPGTIDADYRGEVGVVLLNAGASLFMVERGARIAQLVVAPVSRVVWRAGAVDGEASQRATGGFGSTGTGPIGDGAVGDAEEQAAEQG